MTGTEILEETKAKSFYFKKSGDSSVNISWLNEIGSELYEEMIKLNPNEYISEETYTFVSGTYSYDLPTDFFSIDIEQYYTKTAMRTSYKEGGGTSSMYIREPYSDIGVLCGLFEFDSNGDLNNIWHKTGRGSQQTGYYIDLKDSKLQITPRSSIDTGSKTLRYIPLLTELTAEGDTIFMPRSLNYMYKQFWVEALQELWARDIDKNSALEAKHSAEKKRQLDRIISSVQPKTTRVIKT